MANTRIWIYQSDRKLTNEEVNSIRERVDEFLGQWHAHGKPLEAHFEILHHLLLVLQVNEAQAEASGCSIDKSVALFREIEQSYGINLFDRQRFAYEKDGEVINAHLSDLDDLVKNGEIGPETIVLNNLVQNEDEYKHNFRIPFDQSWHKQLLSQASVPS